MYRSGRARWLDHIPHHRHINTVVAEPVGQELSLLHVQAQ
jgi:hypothetical protein